MFGLLSLTLSAYMYAQQPASSTRNAQPWERYLNELSDVEDFENVTWEDYYDLLNDYAEHPINLNTATREDLERLPFLSAQQIEDILAYIYQYGGMKSRGELAMIESLDSNMAGMSLSPQPACPSTSARATATAIWDTNTSTG